MPLCVRWADDGGEHDTCLTLDRPTLRTTLPGASGPLRWLLPNAGEAGYYRVDLDADHVARLLHPATPLTLSERVGVLGDASAAVAAGTLDAAVVLDRLAPLVALDDPLVTGETVGVVGGLDAHLVPDNLRPQYVRMVQKLYGGAATRLGLSAIPGEPEEERLLRPKVVSLVGDTAKDVGIVAAAAPLADRWLTDRTGVDNDMVDTVLGLAARDGDRVLFDRLVAAARTETDRERRGHLLTALGQFRDPSLTVDALDLALSDSFNVRETFGLVYGTLTHRETQEVAWTWVEGHVDGIAKAVPTIARGYIPYLASGFCDSEHRARAEAFFRPRVGGSIGGARTLNQVLEGIESVCRVVGAPAGEPPAGARRLPSAEGPAAFGDGRVAATEPVQVRGEGRGPADERIRAFVALQCGFQGFEGAAREYPARVASSRPWRSAASSIRCQFPRIPAATYIVLRWPMSWWAIRDRGRTRGHRPTGAGRTRGTRKSTGPCG